MNIVAISPCGQSAPKAQAEGKPNAALAADGAIACFSSNLFLRCSNADRAPQLKRNVGWQELNDMEKPKSKERRIASQVIGNVGLYYVCYRLSCLGWNVMPTARNAKGIDILIYNFDASCTHSIQVKALSKRAPVPLEIKLESFFAEFVVVCRYVLEEKPECFILTPDELRSLAHRGEKENRVSF